MVELVLVSYPLCGNSQLLFMLSWAVAIFAVKLHDEHLLSKFQWKLKAEFAISLFQQHHDNSQINVNSLHLCLRKEPQTIVIKLCNFLFNPLNWKSCNYVINNLFQIFYYILIETTRSIDISRICLETLSALYWLLYRNSSEKKIIFLKVIFKVRLFF